MVDQRASCPSRVLGFLALLALGACTPERGGETRSPSAQPEPSMGLASGPTGNAMWAARQAAYVDLARILLDPLGPLGQTRERVQTPPFTLHDKIFIRRALFDVARPASDGSRALTIVVRWQDALGAVEDELCEGVIVDGPRGMEVRWTRLTTLPVEAPGPARPAPPPDGLVR